ncbi:MULTISPECIES: metallophosphoesterase [Halomonadaceae]|uniref:Metallophosphoesterase n=1 Tax=Modicisalibacter zincidurans TaxID=1178777 RepID=A0ABP9RI46_9GAMM|nr:MULTISPECIES: metallophosphoesterase [Halomonas]MCD6006937.1 metallophosphoesterase [Halomonas sp. IOP_31]MEA3250621.1 metallophosphoesterase [Pseudomonadota bacterium]
MSTMLERCAVNRAGTDYVVGDIHGCYGLLQAALERLDFDTARDRLFCVGDLIDRGPDSRACLELTFEPWFHAVRGNHEELAAQALKSGDWALWIENGGGWALNERSGELADLLEAALSCMPYAIEVALDEASVGIVHAEPPGDWLAIERQGHALKQQLTWARRRIASHHDARIANIDGVVVGHTILAEPINLGNVRYIDLGAFGTGNLHIEALHESARHFSSKT